MKKIAILSDIHSNAWALEAVLCDAENKGATTFINLGDIFYGPILPRKTYDLLQKTNFITIRGNQDRQLYESTEEDLKQNHTMAFVLDDLGSAPLDWMKSLPKTGMLNDEIFLCHGDPDNDLTYLLEDVSTGTPVLRKDAEILDMLSTVESPVIVCGHTHIQRVVTLSTGQIVINPGSVGLPAYKDDLPVEHRMENYTPHASYALMERSSEGWNIELVKVAYPHHEAAKAAIKRGRKDWAYALETGRAL